MSTPRPPENPYALSVPEVLAALGTSTEGLTSGEARARLDEHGANELTSKPPKTLLSMVREQVSDPLILILLIAAAISALLQEWKEAVVILFIVVVNTLIGVVQERKAAGALESLRSISAPVAHVLRDGQEQAVPAAEVVPGEVVLLSDGAMVPADLRLIEAAGLRVQEASLTGESVPTEKQADAVVAPDAPLGDRRNMAYSSSIVTSGRGVGVAVTTGMCTEVGTIAQLLDTDGSDDTPLKRKLASVGRVLTIVGIIAAVIVVAVGVLYGRPIGPQLLVAVALAISVIPESLPATATIVMALGVQRMAKQQALIRRLPAVETLGSASVICTDKTGTLTQNKMEVTKLALASQFTGGEGHEVPREEDETVGRAGVGNPNVLDALLRCAVLCSDASINEETGELVGDPTEGALIDLARKNGLDADDLRNESPRIHEQPFDSVRKRMSVVVQRDGVAVAYVKGAVDELLSHCTRYLAESGERPLTDGVRASVRVSAAGMAEGALRTLGFAYKIMDQAPSQGEDVEQALVFVGLVGMIDPPRPEVRASVEMCREAGIRTVMITGDHAATARAIASDLGIWRPGNRVVDGSELERLTDDELAHAVRETTVFARVSPAHKLRIVSALQADGELVAMTGDGVNDAPALKAADIGVAMGVTGTDVAKEAADMVLLDDRFATIVAAVREGRRVYRNIQKVIQFLLSDNIAEILILVIATALNWAAPIGPVQILWINLATATLPALALGVEPASRNIMKHVPVRRGTLFEPALVRRVAIQGVFVAACALFAFSVGSAAGGVQLGQTMVFAVLAFSQMLRALDQRSNTDPIWDREGGRNPWLAAAVGASAAIMLVTLCMPPVMDIFDVAPLTFGQWGLVLGLALLSLLQIEVLKPLERYLDRRRCEKRGIC